MPAETMPAKSMPTEPVPTVIMVSSETEDDARSITIATRIVTVVIIGGTNNAA
jgi:hypothetical protein